MHNSLQETNSVDEVGAHSSDISRSNAIANEEGTTFGLMHNSLQETNSVDEFGAHSGICDDRNETLKNRGSGSNVSRSDAIANEEDTNAQMSFEGDEAAQLAISDEGVDLHGAIECECL
jgi:hypothetical protein